VNHLTDEILNKFIDNELSSAELSLLNDHIKVCNECLAKLKAQKIVDNNLKRIDTYQAPLNFTEKVMQKISATAVKFKPKKSYFFRVVFSVFILASLTVVAIAFANIPADTSTSGTMEWTKFFSDIIPKLFSGYETSISKSSISLIGTILTFILFISGYFVYESHRKIKNQIDKMG
jgi:hypothetical protein